jgi:hypothetical protein
LPLIVSIEDPLFAEIPAALNLGAVPDFTDPQFARTLVAKLREQIGGRVPRFYQVLFHVRYRDGVPMETKFILAREMH